MQPGSVVMAIANSIRSCRQGETSCSSISKGAPTSPSGSGGSNAFRDVVGLLRSFDYAAHATLFGLISGRGKAAGVIRNEDRPSLISWTKAWRLWVHESFKDGYFDTVGQESFVPQDPAERTILFRIMLLEKLLAEIMGELRNRPHWLGIPIHGLLEVMTSETI
jgi:maltose alpha-D-glucosyltransferase/alpha-amylase